jgi:hypothetical protein
MATYSTGPRVCVITLGNHLVRIDRLLCVRRMEAEVWFYFEGRDSEIGIACTDQQEAKDLFNEIDRMMTKWLAGDDA